MILLDTDHLTVLSYPDDARHARLARTRVAGEAAVTVSRRAETRQ